MNRSSASPPIVTQRKQEDNKTKQSTWAATLSGKGCLATLLSLLTRQCCESPCSKVWQELVRSCRLQKETLAWPFTAVLKGDYHQVPHIRDRRKGSEEGDIYIWDNDGNSWTWNIFFNWIFYSILQNLILSFQLKWYWTESVAGTSWR